MKQISKLIKCSLIGIAVGLCNGLFGSGGGIIAVSGLEVCLDIEEHKAHATAISIILPLAIVSSFFYIKNNYVDWNLTWQVSIGGVIGGFIGARLLQEIPANILRKIFGIFIIIAAIRMMF